MGGSAGVLSVPTRFSRSMAVSAALLRPFGSAVPIDCCAAAWTRESGQSRPKSVEDHAMNTVETNSFVCQAFDNHGS